ncbi:hypothetical protein B0H66DRAFT_602621 [Apodospora peruviana]|uniref:CFEM domain-containing protein n=1 Tax=Apodospora peruviana TaxID=516989 RepID=A0AAE0M3S9_9PEZI|nr:hypothetical protein B0H66DRAFT_602621 [Apodospora peruviana]
MKITAIFVSLMFAGFAAAQLPTCATNCVNQLQKNGKCGPTDGACICADKNYLGDIACCLVGDCEKADQSSAVSFASQICVGFGVTTLPTAVSCTTTGVSSTSTGTGTTTTTSSASAQTAATTTSSGNFGPRQTAHAGLGAIGGIVAAAIML